MIKSIFDEREEIAEARGVALGESRGKIEAILTVLRTRFHRIPKDVETAIRQMTDPIVLDSWTAQAVACQSIDEFAEALG